MRVPVMCKQSHTRGVGEEKGAYHIIGKRDELRRKPRKGQPPGGAAGPGPCMRPPPPGFER